MSTTHHHKAEMIKSDLIKNQTLIGDQKMRDRVDLLKEERDNKRAERQNRRSNRNTDNLNLGLNEDIDMEDGAKRTEKKTSVKKAKKSYRKKIKEMQINRRDKKNVLPENIKSKGKA